MRLGWLCAALAAAWIAAIIFSGADAILVGVLGVIWGYVSGVSDAYNQERRAGKR